MPPAEPQAAREHYLLQQRLTAAAVQGSRVVWSRMGDDLDTSWRRIGPDLTRVVSAAKTGAASTSQNYLDQVLAELDTPAPPAGDLAPDVFGQQASGGGDLQALLDLAVGRTKTALAEPAGYGVDPTADEPVRLQQALDAGQRFLETVVRSEVADAERDATAAGIASRPAVFGYIRLVNLPACSRCVILAGRWYGWNEGFLRHPNCDCRHVPAPQERSTDVAAVPEKAYATGMVTGLNRREREAIDLGADLTQVVNARRKGAVSADGLWTREGTTRRGFASSRLRAADPATTETSSRERGRRQRRVMRPTVTNILRNATDREDAIALLRDTGYII